MTSVLLNIIITMVKLDDLTFSLTFMYFWTDDLRSPALPNAVNFKLER